MSNQNKYQVRHQSRTWLNDDDHGGSAYIISNVTLRVPEPSGYVSLDAQLQIADCTRVIALDFGIYDVDEANNLKKKVKILRDSVNKFCDEFDRALEIWTPQRQAYNHKTKEMEETRHSVLENSRKAAEAHAERQQSTTSEA